MQGIHAPCFQEACSNPAHPQLVPQVRTAGTEAQLLWPRKGKCVGMPRFVPAGFGHRESSCRDCATLELPLGISHSLQGHRQRLQRIWRKTLFAAASPFHHSLGRESGYVLAFEVEWASICGLDYSNPLCQDGRLVIEATHIVKREFQKVLLQRHPAGFHAHACSEQVWAACKWMECAVVVLDCRSRMPRTSFGLSTWWRRLRRWRQAAQCGRPPEAERLSSAAALSQRHPAAPLAAAGRICARLPSPWMLAWQQPAQQRLSGGACMGIRRTGSSSKGPPVPARQSAQGSLGELQEAHSSNLGCL